MGGPERWKRQKLRTNKASFRCGWILQLSLLAIPGNEHPLCNRQYRHQLIEKLLETLKTSKQTHPVNALKRRDRVSDAWFAECPLCFELKAIEGRYLEKLTVVLKNNRFKTLYENSCGLCIPHCVKAINYIDDDSLMDFLYEAGINQLKRIKTNADSFISKRYPPQRRQQTEDEKISWFRAVEKIAGRSGSWMEYGTDNYNILYCGLLKPLCGSFGLFDFLQRIFASLYW